MEKLMVTHRLSLDMSSQAVQATITLAQYDTATHRLIVSLRNGAEVVELPPGSYAVAVQDPEAGVDVLDSVTVYGPDSVYPNCIVYDVGLAVTAKEGYHESQFLITYVNEDGVTQSLSSPRIAFVIKPDIMVSSDVEGTAYYGALVELEAAAKTAQGKAETAQTAAEKACSDAQTAQGKAEAAQAAAETAKDEVKAVGVVKAVKVMDDDKLRFFFSDERIVDTDKSVMIRVRINPNANMWEISSDGGQTWSSTGVKATGHQLVTFYKDYGTLADMEAAVAAQTDDGVPVNGLVMIQKDPTIVNDDNATGRVYRKTLNEDGTYYYEYMADLSGLQGPQGYTPVRGTDYWTETDKAEIKAYVDEAILGGVW